MLAGEDSMQYIHRRMMPTVGCEADAVAFTEGGQEMLSDKSSSHIVFAADGRYSYGPENLVSEGRTKAAFEHCFTVEPRRRLRVIQNFAKFGPAQQWSLANVEVHLERYDGPHTGRRELSGCGGGMEPFAQQPALDGAALEGSWVASGALW
jgi:hypothetical protein